MEVHEYSANDFEHVVLASQYYSVRAEYLTRVGNRRVSVSVVEAPSAACAEWIVTQQLKADELVPVRVTVTSD